MCVCVCMCACACMCCVCVWMHVCKVVVVKFTPAQTELTQENYKLKTDHTLVRLQLTVGGQK